MSRLDDSQLFTAWRHPETGVRFHILTEKVVPIQQGFYFVNDGMSADGRYLWLYCGYPPSPGRTPGASRGMRPGVWRLRRDRPRRSSGRPTAGTRTAPAVLLRGPLRGLYHHGAGGGGGGDGADGGVD